jgi:Primase C terminal 1 (PriCT-1)
VSQIHDVKEIGAVVPPEDPRPSKVKTKTLPASFPRGTQYKTLFREGCRLRRGGYEEAEIAAALWSIHNNRSEGPDAKHEQGDINTIAHSICERYPAGQTAFVRSEKKKTIIPDHQGNIRLPSRSAGWNCPITCLPRKS